MVWRKSKAFLDRLQLISIILYLICLGGYAIPPVARLFDHLQEVVHFKVIEIAGFTFFSLFVAATILLRYEKQDAAGAPSTASDRSS